MHGVEPRTMPRTSRSSPGIVRLSVRYSATTFTFSRLRHRQLLRSGSPKRLPRSRRRRLLRLDAFAEGQGGGAEEMHMDVAGPAEQLIFEMVRLEIGDGVRHVLLARQEGLVPEQLVAAADARGAVDVGGQIADQQFRAKAQAAAWNGRARDSSVAR